MTAPPVRVLVVTGSGRSGSTVLEQVLGQLAGVRACGELRYVWERGLVEDRLCGCGRPFRECPVWTESLECAGVAVSDGPGLAARQRRRLRTRALPGLLARIRRGRAGAGDRPVLARLYRCLSQDGRLLVLDSSKLASYAALVGTLPGLDVRALHLVRDPRATAFSWQRRRALPDFGDERVMQQMPPAKTTLMWVFWNALTQLLWRTDRQRYLRVRYEDFVAEPERIARQVADFAGLPPGTELPFTDPHTAAIEPTHTVSGNPARHRSGAVRLVADDEWTRAMPRSQRLLVTALSLPVLLAYGYRLRGGTR